MADVLFSLSLTSIGRSKHRVGTAGAHMMYILRENAVEHVLARGIPITPSRAAAWIEAEARADRANARICDGIVVALPHQLTHDERVELLRGWCNEITNGVPYIAVIHRPSRDGDSRNHHGHVVARDRDPTTGARVMKTTDRDFAERARASWARHVNDALERAGVDDRTDHRSHARRGIDRLPQLKVGPVATAVARRLAAGNTVRTELTSMAREVTNGVGRTADNATRIVDYRTIDGPGTRYDENQRRIALNAAADRAAALAAERAAALAAAALRADRMRRLAGLVGLDHNPITRPGPAARLAQLPGAARAASAALALQRPEQQPAPAQVAGMQQGLAAARRPAGPTPAKTSSRSAAAALAVDAAARAAMQDAYGAVADRRRRDVAAAQRSASARELAARAGMQTAYAAAPGRIDRVDATSPTPTGDIERQSSAPSVGDATHMPRTTAERTAATQSRVITEQAARDGMQAAYAASTGRVDHVAAPPIPSDGATAPGPAAAVQESAKDERAATARAAAARERREAAERAEAKQIWMEREIPAPTIGVSPDPLPDGGRRGRLSDQVQGREPQVWTHLTIPNNPGATTPGPDPALRSSYAAVTPQAPPPRAGTRLRSPAADAPAASTQPPLETPWLPRTVSGDDVRFYATAPADGGPPAIDRLGGIESYLQPHGVEGRSEPLFPVSSDRASIPGRVWVQVTYSLRALQDLLGRLRGRYADTYQRTIARFRRASTESNGVYDDVVRPWMVSQARRGQEAAASAAAPSPETLPPPMTAAQLERRLRAGDLMRMTETGDAALYSPIGLAAAGRRLRTGNVVQIAPGGEVALFFASRDAITGQAATATDDGLFGLIPALIGLGLTPRSPGVRGDAVIRPHMGRISRTDVRLDALTAALATLPPAAAEAWFTRLQRATATSDANHLIAAGRDSPIPRAAATNAAKHPIAAVRDTPAPTVRARPPGRPRGRRDDGAGL